MLDAKIVKYREALIKDFENRTEGAQNKIEESIDYPSQTSVLPLIIKTYDVAGALSKTVKDSNKGDLFNIQGPVGNGMEIRPNFSGECVIVAAGTGILPFIDLLDLLLKK